MDELERDANAAVLEIRRQTSNARSNLNLAPRSYFGVPTVHTCPSDKPGSIRCDACMARTGSL